MKCLNGLGRFQWANGTVYMGHFEDNAMTGKGKIEWSDECWYEGDFVNNMCHGYGIFVDPHEQQCYIGNWHCGKKHGKGVIYYDHTFKNSYDGEWKHDVRHGFGVREYSRLSGYIGYWNSGARHGEGMMIWENQDVYRGKWDHGAMDHTGEYIWGTFYNNTLTVPSLITYRGNWKNGERHGHGRLYLGFDGAMYVGEFNKNKKHGSGKLITNNGLILQDIELFNNDNFDIYEKTGGKFTGIAEPLNFPFCDYTFGLLYHVERALHDMLNVNEARAIIVQNFIQNNDIAHKPQLIPNRERINELIDSEIECLKKALLCYQKDLLHIYKTYATICNNEEVEFNPILIRLFLWQLYYDCDVIKYDLSLVEIDKMLSRNHEWCCKSVHDPFEKIYFWQFIHSLITVATKIYLPENLPGPQPDSILGKAFRTFMDRDLLPNRYKRKGNLAHGYGNTMPLKAMYKLYRELGEPLTVRTFINAIRYPAHLNKEQPSLIEGDAASCRNVYLFNDELEYVLNGSSFMATEEKECEFTQDHELKLFNFGNLPTKHVIHYIFKSIFPKIFVGKTIVDVDMKMTFYEFFEAFILCAEESIKQEEIMKTLLLNEFINSESPVLMTGGVSKLNKL